MCQFGDGGDKGDEMRESEFLFCDVGRKKEESEEDEFLFVFVGGMFEFEDEELSEIGKRRGHVVFIILIK